MISSHHHGLNCLGDLCMRKIFLGWFRWHTMLKIARFAKGNYGFGIKPKTWEKEDKPFDWDESLALRFESFHSQNWKIQLLSILASSSKRWVCHGLPLASISKDESKDNPWDAWVIELDESLLNLLYTWTKKKSSIYHQKPQISSLEKISRNGSYSSWAHHGQGWRCWWCPWVCADASLLLLLLQSPL